MSLVVDASAILAWIYKEAPSSDLDQLAAALYDKQQATVPKLWRLEVMNVLMTNIRRRRHDMRFATKALLDLSDFNISVDAETDSHAGSRTLDLATIHDLTSYDACYLELALRRSLPLATLDKHLQEAARAAGAILFWS